MNAAKIDPHLQVRMASSPRERRPLFIRIAGPISAVEARKIRQLGVRGVSRGGGIFSATASSAEVAALSDLDCVAFLQGSHRLATKVQTA